ncbi:Peptidase A1 domain-containing protein [Aphelenchoides besseyi]|nr:Peptidase A1 domain-containing protein [Aphelenchoides besseyi]
MEALKVAICFCLVGISTQTYTIQLTNDHDVIYRGKVSVGTPPQEFEAVYHTGTTLTYFPAKGCKASGRFPHACDANKTYDPHASRTSRYWQTFSTQGTLYSNYKASGRDYYDTLTFKDKHTGKELVVKNADVGAASMVWGFGHAVVGLGNQARTYTGRQTFRPPTFLGYY